jgi:hypothetical protein
MIVQVHRDCYGDGTNFDSNWRCDLCLTNTPEVPCRLCPVTGNRAMKAFRITSTGWAHISCVLLVDNLYFCDPEAREGIDGLEESQIEGSCVWCKQWVEKGGRSNGVLMNCWYRTCHNRFHPGIRQYCHSHNRRYRLIFFLFGIH